MLNIQIQQLQEAIDAEERKGERLSKQLTSGDTGDEDEIERAATTEIFQEQAGPTQTIPESDSR